MHAPVSTAITVTLLLTPVLLVSGRTLTMPAVAQGTASAAATCAPREFDVYFDEWRAELTPDARDSIALVQRELSGCAIEQVRIIGLAGARGGETDNLNISMARAEAIAAALEQGGWPASTFELVARGEAGAAVGDVSQPMRRRAHVSVRAAAPR